MGDLLKKFAGERPEHINKYRREESDGLTSAGYALTSLTLHQTEEGRLLSYLCPSVFSFLYFSLTQTSIFHLIKYF